MLGEPPTYDRGPAGLPEEVVVTLSGPREAGVFAATAEGLRARAG